MDGGFQSYIAQKSLEVKSKLAAKPIQVLKLAFCHLFVYMTVLAERWLWYIQIDVRLSQSSFPSFWMPPPTVAMLYYWYLCRQHVFRQD